MGRTQRRSLMKTHASLGTFLRRGCPYCGHPLFRGAFRMVEDCPGCGLDFDRGEPGYFTGAMYISYALAIPVIALLTLLEHLLMPDWTIFALVFLAWMLFLPMIPWIWQFSRTIWIYFDQWVDPVVPGDQTKAL